MVLGEASWCYHIKISRSSSCKQQSLSASLGLSVEKIASK